MGHSVEAAAPAAASALTKQCSMCKRHKARHLFSAGNWLHPRLRPCRACRKVYLERRQKKTQRLLKRFLTFKGCCECGYRTHPDALQFDHIAPQVKGRDYTVMSGTILTGSKRRLKEELAKCQILCSNCHSIKTCEQKRSRTIRTGGRPRVAH